jgi:hypothetical protein
MLDELALSEFHVVDGWHRAPVGALVQISLSGKPTIGWRCNLNQSAALLIVERHVGQLVVSDVGLQPGAGLGLDVSQLVELTLIEPGICNAPEDLPGAVVRCNGAIFVEAANHHTGFKGYACIANDYGTYTVGDVYTPERLPRDIMFGLARTIGVRVKPLI